MKYSCEYEPHPLLFPLTLCSENVISLWSIVIPIVKATWRKSSSVVHYQFKNITTFQHTSYQGANKRTRTHCRSPTYNASWLCPATFPMGCIPTTLFPPYALWLPPEEEALWKERDAGGWFGCCCCISESSASRGRLSPVAGSTWEVTVETFSSSMGRSSKDSSS